MKSPALVAQLDRAGGFYPPGCGFDSCRGLFIYELLQASAGQLAALHVVEVLGVHPRFVPVMSRFPRATCVCRLRRSLLCDQGCDQSSSAAVTTALRAGPNRGSIRRESGRRATRRPLSLELVTEVDLVRTKPKALAQDANGGIFPGFGERVIVAVSLAAVAVQPEPLTGILALLDFTVPFAAL